MKNCADAEEQLKIITVFSSDIGMKFGEDNCAFMSIVNGERKMSSNSICVEGLEIKEILYTYIITTQKEKNTTPLR